MSNIDIQVQRVLETYKSAVATKNVEKLMALYVPDVRVFDTWGTWSYEGAESWQVAVEGWFSSLAAESCKVTFNDLQISGDAGLAVMSAIVTYAGISVGGQELRSMQNRITWVLRMGGHVLRIAHEHTSAPIGFEDMKALLKRESR